MAARKKNTRRTNRKKAPAQKRFSFGNAALGALIIAAAAGWYVAHEKPVNGKPAQHMAIRNNTPQSTQSTIVVPRSKELTINALLNEPLPHQHASVTQMTMHSTVIPALKPQSTQGNQIIVPYKPDTTLPPQGRFAVKNAANAIYAKQRIAIYATANSSSKKIATVEVGQEMRSYETEGKWHRIVVPSTDIIGWARADQLTRSPITAKHNSDIIKTGSIARDRH